jgi:hypothetical protein
MEQPSQKTKSKVISIMIQMCVLFSAIAKKIAGGKLMPKRSKMKLF